MSPKKRFKERDWNKVILRLKVAAEKLEGKPNDEDLDDAVIKLWSCGEYLLNALHEALELPLIKNHKHHEAARDLHAQGSLERNYDETFDKLHRFRKKAEYLGYNTTRATHYNREAVLNCHERISLLLAEVEQKLKDKRFL